MPQAVETVKASFSGAKIGLFAKDKMVGPFYTTSIAPFLKAFEEVNVAGPLATLLGTKSANDILHLKGAAKLSSDVMKKLKNLILDVVDEEKADVLHDKISDDVRIFFLVAMLLFYFSSCTVGPVPLCTYLVQGHRSSARISTHGVLCGRGVHLSGGRIPF